MWARNHSQAWAGVQLDAHEQPATKVPGLLHIPKIIYSDSVDKFCTTKHQFWICCTVNEWPNTAVFNLRCKKIWLCKIIYASNCTERPQTIKKQKLWSSVLALQTSQFLSNFKILPYRTFNVPPYYLTKNAVVQLSQHSPWWYSTVTEKYGLTFHLAALCMPTSSWKSFSRACSPPEPGSSTFPLSTCSHTLLRPPQPEAPLLVSIWGSCEVQPQAGYWLPSQQALFPSERHHKGKSGSSC